MSSDKNMTESTAERPMLSRPASSSRTVMVSSRNVSDTSREADRFKNALSTKGSRVWVPDDTGKYVTSRSRIDSTDYESRSRALQEDYQPYVHRQVTATVSNCGTLMHFFKAVVGTGVLSMPQGFMFTGLVLGSIGTLLIGALVSYGLNLLIKTEYLLCKRKRVGYLSYGDAMQYAMEEGPDWMIRYSKQAKFMVDAVIVVYHICLCCVYMMSMGQNVKKVVDDLNCDVLSSRVLICIFAVVFFAVDLLPNLRALSYLSGVANLIMLVAFTAMFVYFFSLERAPGDRSLVGRPDKWPFFIGICLFAMQAIGMTCAAERTMATPQDFGGVFGVMNLNFALVTVLYWFIGFFGYWIFGEKTKGSMLGHLPAQTTLTHAVLCMFATAMVVSFAIHIYPTFDVLWISFRSLLPRMEVLQGRRDQLYQTVFRSILVLLAFLMAMTLSDYFAIVVAFIGVALGSLLVISFPALLQLCQCWPNQYGKYSWMFYKDMAMFLLGVAVFVIGIYVTVYDMLNQKDNASCSTRQ